MMKPTVHLNGTSKKDLLKGLLDAINALHDAEQVLGRAYPNGRDYYPQGPDAILKAVAEYDARVLKLREIRNELEQIAESLG